ncbi:ABC transporter ATP-binding protein [Actinophytocola sp.]|uniref:ABC transporter ATP-binding protein n=1 Tax=Actinophytocola sp. TaxID=1872138 RepID=UPI00389A2DF3
MTTDPAVALPASWWLRVRTVFALCFRADRRRSALLFALQALANLATLASTIGIKVVIDAVARGDVGRAVAGAGTMAATMGLASVFNRGYLRYTTVVSERAGRYIDTELMRLAGTIPTIEHFERPRYMDQMTLIRQERGALAGAVNAAVLNFRVFVSLAGATVIMGLLHPLLLVLPLFGVPQLLAHRASSRLAQRAREEGAQDSRAREHLYQVAASPSAGKELRLFGLVDELLDRHELVTDRIERRTTRAALRGAALTTGASVLFAAGYVGMIILLIATTGGGIDSVGTIVLVVSLATMINAQLASAAQFGAYFQRVATAAGRLLWLTEVSRRNAPEPGMDVPPPARLSGGIVLDSVSFRYPDSEREVLRDVSVHIPAGSVVAVVGENGSGKSTLVKLLSALYRPSAGVIRVGGTDLASMDPALWQRRVSPAYQDHVRFEFLLGQSVGLGDLPRIDDRPVVTAALARAGAAELADLPPEGLDTQLGTAWGGVELSGGQWQKLALARALVRDESLLVVLDEPAAALDALTEKQLFERISDVVRERAAEGAVTLLVSHRFTTVTMADLIIVLDDGRITEVGDHDTLRRAGGLYQELYDMQSRLYR